MFTRRLVKSRHVQPEKQNLVEPRAIADGLRRRIDRPCKHRRASESEIRLADGCPGPVARREDKGVARLRTGHSWIVGEGGEWRPKGDAARQGARHPGTAFGRLRPVIARSCDAARYATTVRCDSRRRRHGVRDLPRCRLSSYLSLLLLPVSPSPNRLAGITGLKASPRGSPKSLRASLPLQ